FCELRVCPSFCTILLSRFAGAPFCLCRPPPLCHLEISSCLLKSFAAPCRETSLPNKGLRGDESTAAPLQAQMARPSLPACSRHLNRRESRPCSQFRTSAPALLTSIGRQFRAEVRARDGRLQATH